MQQFFDYFDLPEKPVLTLCNPNGSELVSLGGVAYNVSLKWIYNGLSELTLSVPRTVDGENVEAYELIKSKRLILLEGIAYFRLENPVEDMDGMIDIKTVTGYSLESSLMTKKVTLFGGTYKFYDPVSPADTIMQYVLDRARGWSIGTVSGDLLNKYRTFDISDTNLYNLLMDDMAKAYGCVFVFDTLQKTISALVREDATEPTDIFLSFDNLVKNSSMKEMSEEIVTCLSVYGSGDLDIRSVNPLGTTKIYNFDYYKTTDWMSQDLIDAIDAWELLIETNQTAYANALSDIRTANQDLNDLDAEMVALETEYAALEGVQKARIEAGQTFEDIALQLADKQSEIDSKQAEIDGKEAEIAALTDIVVAINDLLDMDANFTEEEMDELDTFIIENTYQNENFIQTDIMTADEIQDVAQSLYEQGQEILAVVSEPRFEFSLESGNFVFLPEFENFTEQLELGSIVNLQVREDYLVEAVVLEIDITYDSPDNFSLVLSNRVRKDDGRFVFSDLFGQTLKSTTSVKFDSVKWKNWAETYKNEVVTFITSSLNATTNRLINSDDQEVVIDEHGLRGKQKLDGGGYSPNQVWLTSSILAFTDDNWSSAKLALGEVSIGETETAYGLVADVIVGRLLAGESLRIENAGGNFILDENGAVLNNADFTINSLDGLSRITLAPSTGIKIQTKISGVWADKFYVDTAGNLVFKGSLTGATGTFSGAITATTGKLGGWTIGANGISDTYGNYINSNGTMKIGQLTVMKDRAIFSGSIYADQIFGEIMNHQIADGAITTEKITEISASKVTSGTLSGDRVYGGTIRWAGVTMGAVTSGVMEIATSDSLYITGASGSQIRVTSGGVALQGSTIGLSGVVNVSGTLYAYGNLSLSGSLITPSGAGLTSSYSVTTPTGTKTFRFSRGILYSVS